MPRKKDPNKKPRPKKWETPPEFAYVYALKHPKTKKVNYVGVSIAPFQRYRSHVNQGSERLDSSRHPKDWWILSLRNQGLKPELEILAKVPFKHRMCYEARWMAKLIREGKAVKNFRDQCFLCAGWELTDAWIYGGRKAAMGRLVKNNKI